MDSTEVLPILLVLEWGFQLGVRQFYTNFGLTLKEPGFLDPSHSRGGGGFRPP